MGSAFWHGSHTLLGNIADNRFIDVVRLVLTSSRYCRYPLQVSFLAHQASLENLNVSTVVWDISPTPRSKCVELSSDQPPV